MLAGLTRYSSAAGINVYNTGLCDYTASAADTYQIYVTHNKGSNATIPAAATYFPSFSCKELR